MATQQSVLGDVFACKPLRNTIFFIYHHVFRVKESNKDEIKDVCMTRFKMAAI